MSRRTPQPLHEPPQIQYLRDTHGTWLGIEVVRLVRWSDALLELPDPEVADVRVAFIEAGPIPPALAARWLVVRRAPAGEVAPLTFEDIADAWRASPWFREPGAAAIAYLEAGMRAMCPPHPACPTTPRMQEMLLEYLSNRHDPLNRLAIETDEGLYRLLRVCWATPQAFADDVLRERIRDDGGRHLVQLSNFLEAADVPDDVPALAGLAAERLALLERLQPLRYFTFASDHDRAAALTLEWRGRYQAAYAAHYAELRDEAAFVLRTTSEAATALEELEGANRQYRPVGEDAARRLREALAEIRALPVTHDPLMATTAGVVLGRVPSSFAAARLAAAAVLAAVSVQRSRLTGAGGLLTRGSIGG